MSINGIQGSTNTNVVLTPTVSNPTAPLANTEYSHTLPANTRRFTLKNRTGGLIKLTYAVGQSGTTWWSVEPGTTYTEEDIRAPALTFYFQSPSANQLLEVISWV